METQAILTHLLPVVDTDVACDSNCSYHQEDGKEMPGTVAVTFKFFLVTHFIIHVSWTCTCVYSNVCTVWNEWSETPIHKNRSKWYVQCTEGSGTDKISYTVSLVPRPSSWSVEGGLGKRLVHCMLKPREKPGYGNPYSFYALYTIENKFCSLYVVWFRASCQTPHTAQDMFQPIQGLIRCAGMTRRLWRYMHVQIKTFCKYSRTVLCV